MSEPRMEAVVAAFWWTDQLVEHRASDFGDRQLNMASAFAGIIRNRPQRTQQEIDLFRLYLAEGIEAKLVEEADSWRPEEPHRGSAFRTIHNDYAPDLLLETAAHSVGFRVGMLDLPMKTVMWINPGEVRVAAGYGAKPVTIWKAGKWTAEESV